MWVSSGVSKFKVFFIKDERGNTSHHYAEEKKWAINAHIEHWGYEGLRTEPRITELMKTESPVCMDKVCLDAARIPDYAIGELTNRS